MSEEAKIVLTLKIYNGPWAVLRADTPTEMNALLESIEASGMYAQAGAADAAFTAGYALGSGLDAKPAPTSRTPGAPAATAERPVYAQASGNDVCLQIPYGQNAVKDELKAKGARWNPDKKGWNTSTALADEYPNLKRI